MFLRFEDLHHPQGNLYDNRQRKTNDKALGEINHM